MLLVLLKKGATNSVLLVVHLGFSILYLDLSVTTDCRKVKKIQSSTLGNHLDSSCIFVVQKRHLHNHNFCITV